MSDQSAQPIFPRSAPEEQGVSSAAVLSFLDTIEEKGLELHSFMLVRHGALIAEGWWRPYAPDRPHMLFSLSKSFTSAAVGLAVEEGLLTVDDTVLSFFPEDAPGDASPNLAAMRVRDLLTMTTGHDEDATEAAVHGPDGNWARGFFSLPVEHAPGTHFGYNSAATYMLSAIVQKLTGKTLLDYLTPRLFEPLGITDATWECCPRGINTGGWGLKLKTEEIARFGQLLLQDGFWNGTRVLPHRWIAEATSKQVENGSAPDSDWAQGYGYQFWRCRHGAYRGDGAFGQYCIVMPEQDAVIAITSGLADMQAVLNVIWETLLPAFRADALAENDAQELALRQRLKGLSLPVPPGSGSLPLAAQVSARAYRLASNDQGLESVSLRFVGLSSELTIRDATGEHRIAVGSRGTWREDETAWDHHEPRAVAATGAWTNDNIYVVRLAFLETPFAPLLTFHFNGLDLTLEQSGLFGFGAGDRPELSGHADPPKR